MSLPQRQALFASASQLAAALAEYDRATADMIGHWPDLERYHEVSAQVETIRMYCSTMPHVRIQWVELLIAHAELVHCLWRVQYGSEEAAREGIAALREHHEDCVAALRNRCRRFLAQAVRQQP